MHNIAADVHGLEKKRKKEITYEGNKCTQLVEGEEEEEATRAVSHLGREEQPSFVQYFFASTKRLISPTQLALNRPPQLFVDSSAQQLHNCSVRVAHVGCFFADKQRSSTILF